MPVQDRPRLQIRRRVDGGLAAVHDGVGLWSPGHAVPGSRGVDALMRHRKDANQAALLEAAERIGWCALNASQSNLGFDAILVKAGRIVLAEIKDGDKPMSAQKLTPHEQDVHAKLKAHGITVEILTSEADVIALERPHRRGSYDDRQMRRLESASQEPGR